MTEHDNRTEERVDDLDVTEELADEVKGGTNFSKLEWTYKSTAQKVGPEPHLNPGGANQDFRGGI